MRNVVGGEGLIGLGLGELGLVRGRSRCLMRCGGNGYSGLLKGGVKWVHLMIGRSLL